MFLLAARLAFGNFREAPSLCVARSPGVCSEQKCNSTLASRLREINRPEVLASADDLLCPFAQTRDSPRFFTRFFAVPRVPFSAAISFHVSPESPSTIAQPQPIAYPHHKLSTRGGFMVEESLPREKRRSGRID